MQSAILKPSSGVMAAAAAAATTARRHPPPFPLLAALCFFLACALPPAAQASPSPCNLFQDRRQSLFRAHTRLTGAPAPFPPNATAFNRKHQPYLAPPTAAAAAAGSFQYQVTVGEGTTAAHPDGPVHPTVAGDDPRSVHYVTTLFVEDQTGIVFALEEFVPAANDERPVLKFDLPAGVTSVRAYAYCNRHGLYVSEPQVVSPSPAGLFAGAPCAAPLCFGAGGGGWHLGAACPAFETFRANLLFRDTDERREVGGATPGTPVVELMVDAPFGQVLVTGDADAIWVEDELKNIVAAGMYESHTGRDGRFFTFPLPSLHDAGGRTTITLRAYVFDAARGVVSGEGKDVFLQDPWDKAVPPDAACGRCVFRTCAPTAAVCDRQRLGTTDAHPHPPHAPVSPPSTAGTVECRDSLGLRLSQPRGGDALQKPDELALTCVATLDLDGVSVTYTENPLTQILQLSVRTPWPSSANRKWLAVTFPDREGQMSPASGVIAQDGHAPPNDKPVQTYVIDDRRATSVQPGAAGRIVDGSLTRSVTADILTVSFRFKQPSGKIFINVARNLNGAGVEAGLLDAHAPSERVALVLDPLHPEAMLTVVAPDTATRTCNATAGDAPSALSSAGRHSYLCSKPFPGMDGATLHWDYEPRTRRLHVAVASDATDGWLALGLQAPGVAAAAAGGKPPMTPAVALIAADATAALVVPAPAPTTAWYSLVARQRSGIVRDVHFAEEHGVQRGDEPTVTWAGGRALLEATLTLPHGATSYTVLAARDRVEKRLSGHGAGNKGGVAVDFAPLLVWDSPAPRSEAPSAAPGATPTLSPPSHAPKARPDLNPYCTPSTVVGYHCMRASQYLEGLSVHWTYDNLHDRLHIMVRSSGQGWLAFAFAEREESMAPADAVVFCALDSARGVGAAGFRVASLRKEGVTESNAVKQRLGLLSEKGLVQDGETLLRFSVTATAESIKLDRAVNVARSRDTLALGAHDPDQRLSFLINFEKGELVETGNDLPRARRAHASCMVFAFGFILPAAVLCKRYGDTLRLGPRAFYAHAALSLVGVLLVLYGFATAIKNFGDNQETDYGDHNVAGYFVFVAAVLVQPLLGATAVYASRGTLREQSVARTMHRVFGPCLGIVAVFQCFSGFRKLKFALNDESRTVVFLEVGLILAILFYFVVILYFEVRRRRETAAAAITASVATPAAAADGTERRGTAVE